MATFNASLLIVIHSFNTPVKRAVIQLSNDFWPSRRYRIVSSKRPTIGNSRIDCFKEWIDRLTRPNRQRSTDRSTSGASCKINKNSISRYEKRPAAPGNCLAILTHPEVNDLIGKMNFVFFQLPSPGPGLRQ